VYPPEEGYGTVAGNYTTFHLTPQEWLFYTEAPAKIRETVSSSWQYDLEMPATNGAGSIIIERLGNTGTQTKLYDSPPAPVAQVWPGYPTPSLGWSNCVFQAFNLGWAELGSPSPYLRAGLSQDGIYSNCNIPLGGGLSNLTRRGLVTTSHVVFIKDDREGVDDAERVHLMIIAVSVTIDLLILNFINPSDPSQILFSYRLDARYVPNPLGPTGSPHPQFPSGSTTSMSATVFGKSISLYPRFVAGPDAAVEDSQPCWISVSAFNFSNVSFAGTYNLEFVPDPP
jgi:hypothetical protein